MAECENSAKETKSVSKLDCSICLSSFKVPKLLPCYHTFCLQCLEEYVLRNSQQGTFECPLCRVSTVTPVGGVKAFQSNFYIHVGEMSSNDVDCDICGSDHEATHYCVDCEEHFCERCATAHMKMKVSREHNLLKLDDSSEGAVRYIPKIRKKSYCSGHHGEEIKMICKECKSLLCVVCKLTEHENHNTSSIENEASNRRATLSSKLTEAKKVVDELKSNIMNVDECLKEFDVNKETSIGSINKRVGSIIVDVHATAEKMKHEIIENNKEAKNYYLQEQKELQNKIVESEGVINHAQNVLDFGDDIQVVEEDLHSRMEAILSRECCPVEEFEQLKFKAGFCRIKKDLIGQNVFTHAACWALTPKEITGSLSNTKQAHTLSAGSDRLFASFRNCRKLYYYNIKTDKFKSIYELTNEGERCVCLRYIDGDIYFTKYRSIYKYDVIEKAKTKLKTFDEYPHDIAYRTIGREVLICLLNTPDVFVLKACEGCVVSMQFANKKHNIWREKETPGPTCVAVNEVNGLVCLGYPYAHKVTVNAPNGEVLSEFNGTGCHGNPMLFCPVSVCFDSTSDIVVADYRNHAVVRLDISGRYLKCLIADNIPLCVAFGDSNSLYVGYHERNITRYLYVTDDQ